MKREHEYDTTSKRQRRNVTLTFSYDMPVVVDTDKLQRIIDAGPHTLESIKAHVPTLQELARGLAYRKALKQERVELAAEYWTDESFEQICAIIETEKNTSVRSALWLELGRQTRKKGQMNRALSAFSRSDCNQALFELARIGANDDNGRRYIEKLETASQRRQNVDGSTDATAELARVFASGYKTYVDKKIAWKCYLDAVSRGHCRAIVGLAFQLEWGTNGLFNDATCRYDAVLAFELLKVAVSWSEKARINLARMYADGIGVKRDFQAAIELLRPIRNWTFRPISIEVDSIVRNDPLANKTCPEKLVEHLTKLNTRGSKLSLAYLYRYGIGVEQNDAKSAEWLTATCEDQKQAAALARVVFRDLSDDKKIRIYRDIKNDVCLRVHADTLTMPELEMTMEFAAENMVKKLYLNGLNLEALPNTGWKFLELIDLRDNKLRTLPPSFKHQKHVKTLLLSGNDWDDSYAEDVIHMMLGMMELREVVVDKGSERFLNKIEFLCLQRARNREFTEQILAN